MANKYVAVGSSTPFQEVEATVTSAGAGDAGEIVALNGSGKIDDTLLPDGIGADTITFTASETLTAGNFINLWNDGGTLKGRKADNSNARRADGFIKAGVSSGASGTLYRAGQDTNQSGLTAATRYYLGTSGGTTASVPAAGANVIVQEIGIAFSATEIDVKLGDVTTRV
jgi:hypothetical protein